MTELADSTLVGLLDAAPDAMVVVNEDGVIVLFNEQAERLFGYPRAEMVGQPIEVLVPEHARKGHPRHRSHYMHEPQPRPMGAGVGDLSGRRKDGSEFPAEISLSAIQTESGMLVSASIRDVTDRLEAAAERERLKAQAERERLESQLHQSQRMESLGQLAGGVAHDFNNLLAVILNYASFVGEEIAAELEATHDPRWQQPFNDVEQIQEAAKRAGLLTHQLLAFARREVVQPRVLNLNTTIGNMEEILRRTIGEQVELSFSMSDELPSVMADPGQIEQVALNLAINARDAMPEGGVLSIDTSITEVSNNDAVEGGPSAGRYVRLRVGDTGTGMTPDVIERCFEPFFTTKPKGEGSGLGLATVYGIVSQAGGHTMVYSEPGFGTTITVLLPVTDEDEGEAAVDGSLGANIRGVETILVVEDEDAIREVTRRILNRNGYKVLSASGGAEAIGLCRNYPGPIDLLLTDVIMPKMQGKAVAEEVGKLRPGIPVLYMSGYAQPILGAGADIASEFELVEKPFSEGALLTKLRALLDAA